VFTANVSGVGTLYPPGTWWSFSLEQLLINITSDHPQTLQITLTSPAGTDLLLSEFNGAGGQNYTNTVFTYSGWPSIILGSAPFTGWWTAQGGSFSIFDYENANGTWVITVIDTSCVNGGSGPNGNWTPGWFDGSGSNGGFYIAFNYGYYYYCWGDIPDDQIYICPNETVDILGYYDNYYSYYIYTITLNGSPVANPSAVSTPGSYLIDAYDPYDGCFYIATFEVIGLPGVVLGPDQLLDICSGDSIDLTTLYTTTGLTSNWLYGGSPFLSPNIAINGGIYTLIAINSDGCTDTAEVTLNVQAVSLGADQSLDLCNNSTLDLTGLYVTSGLTSSWTLLGASVATPSAVSSSGTYELVATNSIGCTDTASVSVNVVASPSLGPDSIAAACVGDLIDLTTYYSTSGLASSWSLTGTAVPAPNAIGTSGYYTLTATNTAGCSDTANVNVTVSPLPVLGPDQSIAECFGTVVDLTIFYSSGNNSTIWTESGIPVADPTSVSSGGNYTLTATSPAGCMDSAVVTLTIDTLPVLGADQSASICSGSIFDLTTLYSTTGLSSTWTINGSAVVGPTVVSVAGAYQLVVENSFGCTDTATVDLVVNTNPSLGPDLSYTLCPWQTVDLSNVFPVSGLSAAYTLNSDPVADPLAVHDPGAYVVTVIDANGCSDEAIATITNIECLCEAEFVHNADCIQDQVQFTLLADSLVLDVNWDFGGAANISNNTEPLVQFIAEQEVQVTVEVILSCGVVTLQQAIEVQDCSDVCSLWIPNAFTPDGDAVNDTWSSLSDCMAKDYSMQIFNRYGKLIFDSTDPLDTWDGTYGNTAAPVGVYVYSVEYRLPYQEKKRVTGHVSLVR